jgi:SAM-dependent methyltransferase
MARPSDEPLRAAVTFWTSMYDIQACDCYFDTFRHYSAHEELLEDKVRCTAFRDAICGNPSLFTGKVVLDAGCGTGIFAMWIAKFDCQQIYAVECCSIAEFAKQIIADNHLSDRIEVIQADIETVELPHKVDTIICDFFNTALLFDGMLRPLIIARDRLLKPDGCVFPSKATMSLAAVHDPDYKMDQVFWHNVYGFDFHIMGEKALEEADIRDIVVDSIITDHFTVFEFETKTVRESDLDFTRPFLLRGTRPSQLNGFVIWFDILFNGPEQDVVLSTSPGAESTAYSQALCRLREPFNIARGGELRGQMSMRRNELLPKNLDIAFEFTVQGRIHREAFQLKA